MHSSSGLEGTMSVSSSDFGTRTSTSSKMLSRVEINKRCLLIFFGK